jgi:hypothetical protein
MRERLLAPYLERFDVWANMAASVDDVWKALGIDDAVSQLKWLRSPINVRDVVVGNAAGAILPLSAVPQQDRVSLVLTADMLGFRYYETNLLDTDDYLKLCRHLAEYYNNDKGTPAWTDFLGWCLNTDFKVYNTWTQDYQTFLLENDPAIGASIADGGSWYPTTHVVLEYDQNRFAGVPPSQLIEFFNYFANVNLVLWMTQVGGLENLQLTAAVTGMLECEYPGSI